MILCVGEILVDMIGSPLKDGFYYERKAGGAVFNVACAVGKLGGKSAFVGNVGDDLLGKFLMGFAKNQSVDPHISLDERHNTTVAFVELDFSGERSFSFYRKNTADYFLPEIDEELLNKASIVHIGSLMLSEEAGLNYATKLVAAAKRLGKMVSFDINYRTDIFGDSKKAVETYKKIISEADILKFSEDEVEIFTPQYIASLTDKLVLISLGSMGSKWQYRGRENVVGTIKVKPVDTTGAGDAFYGGALYKLSQLERESWTDESLNETLKFANICGALNTLGKGAIDNLPTKETVLTHLN